MTDSDQLRTALANERTLLAYIRTALSLMIFGMAIIKFFPEEVLLVLFGWAFLGCGAVLLIWGGFHFRKIAVLILKL
ncbi:MAG: DUF202 domain-containing protein [Candidatus Omnitrophica bacterium]|nr:DUF202 domain-containing protein [Candidatus Omnitrophota bacterium]